MRNWAGNVTYRARTLHEPTSVDELQAVVAGVGRAGGRIRALGTRHSFNDVADTDGDLVSLGRLPRRFDVDAAARTVTVDGGVRFGDIGARLDDAGFALHTMASLPHISVAGAIATATHGSGVTRPNLSAAVVSLDLVKADGDVAHLDRRDDPETFDGSVVALGALGVVVAVTLAVEPAYAMRQDVYEELPIDPFCERFDEIAAMAESVSFFTGWRGPTIDQVWLKSRVEPGGSVDLPRDLYGAVPAAVERHPIRGLDPIAATAQLGAVGRWYERLPHFRLDHTPSSGDELQAELFVDRRHAPDAFRALDRMRVDLAPLVQVSEIRTIAADGLWLSPAYGRESVAFHFTWVADARAVAPMLRRVEAALEPFQPRPHWGKLSSIPSRIVRGHYERVGDFVDLANRLDPGGVFRNDFVDRALFDAPS
jgi:alditol oxidase